MLEIVTEQGHALSSTQHTADRAIPTTPPADGTYEDSTETLLSNEDIRTIRELIEALTQTSDHIATDHNPACSPGSKTGQSNTEDARISQLHLWAISLTSGLLSGVASVMIASNKHHAPARPLVADNRHCFPTFGVNIKQHRPESNDPCDCKVELVKRSGYWVRYWSCCMCGDGPMTAAIHKLCPLCGHRAPERKSYTNRGADEVVTSDDVLSEAWRKAIRERKDEPWSSLNLRQTPENDREEVM